MANRIENQYTPDYVSPPGETLLELLEERQMSQAELARRMGRPHKTINEIIHGKAAITPETARQLEHVLGAPASFWNNREQAYRAFLAAQAERERLQEAGDWVRRFPVNDMVRLGWIKRHSDQVEQTRGYCVLWRCLASPMAGMLGQSAGVLCRARSFDSQPEALTAWLRQGEIMAQRIACRPYDAEACRRALQDVRPLTAVAPEVFTGALQDLCAQAGVAVVFVPKSPAQKSAERRAGLAPIRRLFSSACATRPMTNSGSASSTRRGISSCMANVRCSRYEDGDGEKEDEADRFAAEFLIPSRELASFLEKQAPGRYPSTHSICAFADALGIAPGIVAGRLQHDGHVPFTHYHDLKRRFEWG